MGTSDCHLLPIITCTNIAHICSDWLKVFWVLGVLSLQEYNPDPNKQFPLKDGGQIRNTGGEMKKEKAKILYKQKSKNFLIGFWCPTHGGNLYVLVSQH